MNYKQECLNIYYASDVVNRTIKLGCLVKVKYTNINPRTVATDVYEVGDGKDHVGLANNTGTSEEVVYLKRYDPSDNYIQEVICHPPTGFDWLQLLKDKGNIQADYFDTGIDQIRVVTNKNDKVYFNLKTQEPTDWEALYKIIKPGDNTKD